MDAIWDAFLNEDIALPMFSSLITGMLIGLEREVRAKPAGLRTHALVCFAATILMLAAARQAEWTVAFLREGQIVTDPTRMAHGVLTGIGFLCAGVIFREGASIHGLTTAASLWTTSAIGLLYGVGMYWLAVSGALATLAVLVLLRLINWVLPRRVEARLTVSAMADGRFDAAALRNLLEEIGATIDPISRALLEGERIELGTRAKLSAGTGLDELTERLTAAPGVIGFRILPEEDPGFYQQA